MKKNLFVFLMVLLGTFSGFSQMTQRIGDTSVYKLGNRPVKGTKLLTFGLSLNSDTGLFSKYNLFQRGNLLTGKYFITDNLAIRGGIRLSKISNVSAGPIDTAITGGTTIRNELKETTRNYALMPGLEYHFSNSNFFDVYAGGDLYLGFERYRKREDYDFTNDFYTYRNTVKNSTKLGLGGIVGINMFVLDLPISIGVEYGLSGIWHLGNKYHVKEAINDALGERKNEYYTQDLDAFNNPDANSYTELKKRSSVLETNNNVRLLVNIYFK